jgi:hypothetical protein
MNFHLDLILFTVAYKRGFPSARPEPLDLLVTRVFRLLPEYGRLTSGTIRASRPGHLNHQVPLSKASDRYPLLQLHADPLRTYSTSCSQPWLRISLPPSKILLNRSDLQPVIVFNNISALLKNVSLY